MKPGDLVQMKMGGSTWLYGGDDVPWDDRSMILSDVIFGDNQVGTIISHHVCDPLEDNISSPYVKIFSPNGIGWILIDHLEVIS